MLREWLKTLGITELCAWDVLVFLHRHRTPLLSAEQIARLVSYDAARVMAALDQLEIDGMVERSRLSQGARLYSVVPLDGPRGLAFHQLIAATINRGGRVALAGSLAESKGRAAVVLKVWPGSTSHKTSSPRIGGKGGKQWPKAV